MRMNLKKMISATYKKAAIGISILMFATSAGYTFNPVEVKADDEKPAMNVEYHSKQDIVDYYNKHPFDGDMDTKYKEEPDVFAPYNLGSLTQKTIDNAQNMVNVVRYVAGLSGMTVEDASLSKSAQAAALANAANGELSHYPRRPRDMSDNMYNLAQEGASSSNIAMTSGRMTLPMSIRMYLSDADSGNRSRVGHRRWILYPTLYKIGFGHVEGYTATRVIGGERNYSAKEYGVAWPAQNTPVELLSYSGNSSVNLYPWSISFGQAPGSDINVTLINNQTGYSWHFGNDYADGEFYVNNGGYGQRGCVIFYPEYLHMSKGDSYTVQINNIGISGYQDTLVSLMEKYNVVTSSGLNASNVASKLADASGDTLSNYIIDILYKLPSKGWDALLDGKFFDGIQSVVEKTHDALLHFNYFLGLNISDTPWYIIKSNFTDKPDKWLLFVILALLIPVLSYLTQMINIKLMPQATNGNDQMASQMKMMNLMMPLMSLFFCFTVPVGLGIYWICSALVRGIQQFFVNRHIENLDLEAVMAKNEEKAKNKRKKMGLSEDYIKKAAQIKTKSIDSKANVSASADTEEKLAKAAEYKANAKAGSLASKANMVKEFNERNSRK